MTAVSVGVDLDAARRDVRAFVEVCGYTLTDHQVAFIGPPMMGEGPQIHAALCGRQGGKTVALAGGAAFRAMREPGSRILIVSASEQAAKRVQRMVRDMLSVPAFRGSITEETTTLLRLSNGSWIGCTTTSEAAIRGQTLDVLIGDELAYVGDELWTGAALPTIAATGGRIVVASSAGPAYGWFYDVVQRGRAGSEHVRLTEWTYQDVGWISPSVISALQDSMPRLKFEAEILNVFAGTGALFFGNGQMIRSCIADVQAPRLAGLALGDARGWFGLDPAGAGADRNALCGFVRVPEAGDRVFLLAEALALPAGAPLSGPGSMTEIVAECGAPMGRLTVETNGVGTYLAEFLSRRLQERPVSLGGAVPDPRDPFDAFAPSREVEAFATKYERVHTDAAMKSAAFSAARVMLERGSIVIPAELDGLVRELLLLGVEMNPTGGERIAATSGHDDLAMSFALALQPYRRRGRWMVALAERAEPSREVPSPMRAATGLGDLVTTPGGVMLPSRPVLQSVDWPHLTVPVDPDAVAAEPPGRARAAAAWQAIKARKGMDN